jgi:hypothetical protein
MVYHALDAASNNCHMNLAPHNACVLRSTLHKPGSPPDTPAAPPSPHLPANSPGKHIVDQLMQTISLQHAPGLEKAVQRS